MADSFRSQSTYFSSIFISDLVAWRARSEKRNADDIRLQSVERSDQMRSYCELCKSIRWYRKVVFNLLLSVSVINAHFLYQKVTGNRLPVIKFKELIVKGE